MPLLKAENPSLAENLSAMALRLRQDEAALDKIAVAEPMPTVAQLKAMDPAIRSRILEKFLKENGIREPEAQHIALAEALVFSDKPSATAAFPGGITLGREYGRLTLVKALMPLETVVLSCPGVTELPQLDLRVICQEYDNQEITRDSFTAAPSGTVIVRARKSGDSMRFPGGTKSLKKWMIDEMFNIIS